MGVILFGALAHPGIDHAVHGECAGEQTLVRLQININVLFRDVVNQPTFTWLV